MASPANSPKPELTSWLGRLQSLEQCLGKIALDQLAQERRLDSIDASRVRTAEGVLFPGDDPDSPSESEVSSTNINVYDIKLNLKEFNENLKKLEQMQDTTTITE